MWHSSWPWQYILQSGIDCQGHNKYEECHIYKHTDYLYSYTIAMYMLTCDIPSQSARSLALASAVERPTILTFFSVCEETKLVRDTITSSTGPRSSPRRESHQ